MGLVSLLWQRVFHASYKINHIKYIFFAPQNENTTGSYKDETPPPDVRSSPGRSKRNAELSLITYPPTFTATVSEHTHSPSASSLTLPGLSADQTDAQPEPGFYPTVDPLPSENSSTIYNSSSHASSTHLQSSAFALTSVPPATLPPWLTKQSQAEDMNSDPSHLARTPNQLRSSTRDASAPGHFSTRSTAGSGTTGGRVLTVNTESLNFLQPLIYR